MADREKHKNVASPAQSTRTDGNLLRSLLHKRQTCASRYTQSKKHSESVKAQILLHPWMTEFRHSECSTVGLHPARRLFYFKISHQGPGRHRRSPRTPTKGQSSGKNKRALQIAEDPQTRARGLTRRRARKLVAFRPLVDVPKWVQNSPRRRWRPPIA